MKKRPVGPTTHGLYRQMVKGVKKSSTGPRTPHANALR